MGSNDRLMPGPPELAKLDLGLFKAFTVDQTIVAGRKTAESMAHLQLHRRYCLYLSSTHRSRIGRFMHVNYVDVPSDAICIGGARTFALFALQLTDLLVVERPVHGIADTYFPLNLRAYNKYELFRTDCGALRFNWYTTLGNSGKLRAFQQVLSAFRDANGIA